MFRYYIVILLGFFCSLNACEKQKEVSCKAFDCSLEMTIEKIKKSFLEYHGYPLDIACDVNFKQKKVLLQMRSDGRRQMLYLPQDFVDGLFSSWIYGTHSLEEYGYSCDCFVVDDWVAAHVLKICTGHDKFACKYDLLSVVRLILNKLMMKHILMPGSTMGYIDIDMLCENFKEPQDEAEMSRQITIVELVQDYNKLVDKLNEDHNHPFARAKHLTYFD